MAARTPGAEKHARVSSPGFHAAIFSSRFIYGLARRLSERGLLVVYDQKLIYFLLHKPA